MPVLVGTNIRHAYGNEIILDGVSLSVEPGERVGIVGRNGGGKSTLIRILAGELACDSGMVSLQRGGRASLLRQDPVFEAAETVRGAAESAFAELHETHRQLDAVFHAMADAGADAAALERLMKEQARLETRMEALGGHAVDHKIDAVLHGLGFSDAQFPLGCAALSGGQRNRLALAKLLLEEPDVLLLDEPTNHLDIEGREWLEKFLNDEYRGAVILISHDRYLLDAVVDRIVEVEQGRLIDYPGNYSAFRELRAERRLSMSRAYENQQDKFRKEEAFIRRYKAGQRAKQARGRQTKLEREKLSGSLERPMELATFRLELPKAERAADVVLSARGLAKRYAREDGTELSLFRELDVSIARGERWGVIGPNGAGKTTLVRCLIAELDPDAGTARLGTNVNIGHYRQRHDHLDPEFEVWRYLQKVILRENPGLAWSEQQARDLAGAFLFSGSDQERLVGTLSGGERSRAVLAGLLASAKNLLVLDEPTNHLDIPSAERLEEALSIEGGFEGTVILISHDRALIDSTCDHLLIFDGAGNVTTFIGNYSQWQEKQDAKRAAAAEAEAERKRQAEREEKRRKAAAAPAPPKPKPAGPHARLAQDKLEAMIEKMQSRLATIDAELCDPGVWKDAARRAALLAEREKRAGELAPLEAEWFSRAEEG